jgi:hypothetical protein
VLPVVEFPPKEVVSSQKAAYLAEELLAINKGTSLF